MSPRQGFPLCAWHYSKVRQGKISEDQLAEIALKLKGVRDEYISPALSEADAPAVDEDSQALSPETNLRSESVTTANEAVLRTCPGTPGHSCSAPIGAKSTTGLCTRCYARAQYQKKHPKTADKAAKPATPCKARTAVQPTTAATNGNGHEVRTVDIPGVPVAYLDQWFVDLDPSIKGALFVEWLQQKGEARA
jgi:hypothetical protein